MTLQTWNVAADMFNGVDTAGPVPYLASQDVDGTREGLDRHINKVNRNQVNDMITFKLMNLMTFVF